MIRFSKPIGFFVLLGVAVFTGCKQTMMISDVDYSQPIETVLQPTEEGMVSDVQHGISFNVLSLHFAETGDSTGVANREIRMIRGQEGYYYITASGYQNVYVMAPEKGSFKLKNKIKIKEGGIAKPAFNQRTSYIQLLNRETGENYALNVEGIRQMEENEETATKNGSN
jgi:hypothetical protein